MFMPLADFVDERGRHTYARFVKSLEGFAFSAWIREIGRSPAAFVVSHALKSQLPHLSEQTFSNRRDLVSTMFLSSLIALDAKVADGLSASNAKRYISDVLTMCAAALEAPDI
jgi:hypothetical protein